MSDPHQPSNVRQRAEEVALQDLAQCAQEILAWRRGKGLPDDALLRQVAAVWEEAGDTLPEQQAENTVILLALRHVAGQG